MLKEEWRIRITEACEDAGTYRPFFDSVIDTLAGILEKRDEAEDKFIEGGSQVVIEHYMYRAEVPSYKKNPVLQVLNDMNTQALAYWRDLGLTPAGYRKLNADVITDEKQGGFEKLLERLIDE